MKVRAFDIEGNNLLPDITKVWCGAICDPDAKQAVGYGPSQIQNLILDLQDCDRIVGHNAVSFDRPALAKVLGVKTLPPLVDTILLSRLVYPDKKSNPVKGHSLKLWGEFLGYEKKHSGIEDWTQFTPDMLERCESDAFITARVLEYLLPLVQNQSEAIRLEHQFAAIIQKQVANGFCLDKGAVDRLRERLHKDRAEAVAGLSHIPPWTKETVLKTRLWRDPQTETLYETKAGAPKDVQKRLLRDGPYRKRVEEVPFNPASGDHKARFFQEKYGWVPKKTTETGKPAVDRDVLKTLPYPEAKILSKMSIIDKVLSTYVDAWTAFERGGRVHGEVITNGTVTGRCSHHSPNMNCPKVKIDKDKKPIFGFDGKYGADCRSCFTARPGWALVGCDASGLELRMLAHYMAEWDGGAYGKAILEGDIHTENQKAAGLPSRDTAKTFDILGVFKLL